MRIISWYKKIFKKRMNNKGFSSVVGAVFMVLIMITLASGFYSFTLSQNTTYNQVIREKNQLDIAVMSENVQALNASYVVNPSGVVTIRAEIQNIGSSAVTLVNLWIHVVENLGGAGLDNYNFSQMDITLQAGETLDQPFPMPVAGVSSSGSYGFSAWFITSRGNTIALRQFNTEEIVVSQTTQGIGALSMDFQDFRYYTVNTGNRSLVSFPTGSSGYTVTTGTSTPIAFKIILTNLNYQTKGDITLQADSVFFSIFPTSAQQVRGSYWYIVNVNEQGIISATYTNIVLRYNVPTAVYFASANAIKGGASFTSSNPGYTGTSPINLALIGTKDDQPFGQNIPFVSISVS